ncbi:SAM-dependent methyltransferase [Microbacterium foliorum]
MNGDLQSIRLIGGVLPAALLGRIQANELSNPQSISGASYHLVGNEKPKDAAARAWSYLRGAWTAWRDASAREHGLPGTGAAREKWLLVLLDELGYGRLPVTRQAEVIDGTEYPISHRWYHVPIHLLGPGVDLDKRNQGVPGAARAPQAMLQEYLNRSDDDLWGILSNGIRLRLLRDSTAFAGSAYVEFDLEAIFDGELYAEFQLMWLLCHVSRVEKRGRQDAGPADCWLEEWRAEAAEAGTRALNRLRDGVEASITTLGSGFLTHPANDWLRTALHNGSLTDREYHKALLRLIYRMLFLFVAEERGALLDPAASREARQRYGEYFSAARLRRLSRLRSGGTHPDLWRGQRLILTALGDRGMPQVGVPALGGLFDPDRRAPIIDGAPHRDLLLGAELTNKNLLRAIRHLAWILVPGQRAQPIDYRHLGAEELGGVYESLLELVPRVDLETRQFFLAHLSGNERKTTGSYYTPPALVSALLDASLDPALDEAVTSGQSPAEREANLLAVTVCDPASGSGGFLVAAARRIARRLAQVRSDEDEPTPKAVQRALHDVVARCIYGVDMNDLAAELAKVSLWLEALEPGKPLGFLDARIRVGNSLFGTTPALIAGGVPDAAFKEIEGDSKAFAAEVRKRNKNEATGQGLLSWADPDALAAANRRERALLLAPSDDVDDIRARGEAWDAYLTSDARQTLKRQADAWAAAFVWPLRDGTPLPPTTAVVRAIVDDDAAVQYPDTVDGVARLAHEYRFFHWHLEFPEIFGAISGDDLGPDGWADGFTCMLGNPPWEQIELNEKEFFASKAPEISAATGATRKRLIANLTESDPILDGLYRSAKRQVDGLRCFASGGRFPLTGRGRVNTYAVFAELFRGLTKPVGRTGVIVQSGIATDDSKQHFFKDVVKKGVLHSLYDFDNTEGLFPAVDSRQKFCLLTLGGRRAPSIQARFAFFLSDPLRIAESEFAMTPEEITLLNPNTGTAPVFRSRRDAELAISVYRRFPVMQRGEDEDGNPWLVQFRQGLFNMTSDSDHFQKREALEEEGWELSGAVFTRGSERMLPLYEGKMVHHFDHRWATFDGGEFRDLSSTEKSDPAFVPLPRYWVDELIVEQEITSSAPYMVGFRDTTNATNERTVIASMWPRSAVGNNLPILTVGRGESLVLATMMSSFAFDYVARLKLGGSHANFFIMKQLPVAPPEVFEADCPWAAQTLSAWLMPRAAELVMVSGLGVAFSERLGNTIYDWDVSRRGRIRAEIDGAFFHLFGFAQEEINYIMDSFPIVKRKDEAEFGEYRTKRLILENYDRMQECIDTGTEFVSTLDPAPGFGPRHPERTTDG